MPGFDHRRHNRRRENQADGIVGCAGRGNGGRFGLGGGQVFLTVPNSEDSAFLKLQAGSGIQYKFSPKLTGLADISVQQHSVLDNHAYDYATLDTSAGGLMSLNNNIQVQGKLQLQKMWLDGEAYRDVTGVLAQGQYAIRDNSQLAVFSQLSQLLYNTQHIPTSFNMINSIQIISIHQRKILNI